MGRMNFKSVFFRPRVFDAKSGKVKEDTVHVVGIGRGDSEGASGYGGGNGQSSGVNVVRGHGMSCAAQIGRAGNSNSVGAQTGNLGAHFDEHFAQINNMRFAGGVFDGGRERS